MRLNFTTSGCERKGRCTSGGSGLAGHPEAAGYGVTALQAMMLWRRTAFFRRVSPKGSCA
jgi:hypothetical protein